MLELEEKFNIKDLIYEVRGKQVMLDSDLAKLYGCSNGTKAINLAVKRNSERFPNNFYFQLSKEEYDVIRFKYLWFQNETTNMKRCLPYVFTEQGVVSFRSIIKIFR